MLLWEYLNISQSYGRRIKVSSMENLNIFSLQGPHDGLKNASVWVGSTDDDDLLHAAHPFQVYLQDRFSAASFKR